MRPWFNRLGLIRKITSNRRVRSVLGFEETLWTRRVADAKVRELVMSLRPDTLSALEISGDVWRHFGFASYQRVEFPQFDICQDRLPQQFDLVIAEHVFEHLQWPHRAGCNVLHMLKPGGHFLVVTPFIYKVHPNPFDCTRWTPTGLQYFLAECGFPLETVTTGSWGNRACIEATFIKEYRLFNRYVHSLDDEPEYPMVVWALAEKAK
jgi:SAM-dependent methyltransferase